MNLQESSAEENRPIVSERIGENCRSLRPAVKGKQASWPMACDLKGRFIARMKVNSAGWHVGARTTRLRRVLFRRCSDDDVTVLFLVAWTQRYL